MMLAPLLDPGPLVSLDPNPYPLRQVRWGHPWQVGTPAFWVGLAQVTETQSGTERSYRLGSTLAEEVAACLLGGHGIPHQVGLAAFAAVRENGLLGRTPCPEEIERVLRAPLTVGGRAVRYRFSRRKAAFLSAALDGIQRGDPPESARELRQWLLRLPGIGPKTSGWIVRNYLGSDEVAIIDIHVHRAGVEAGVFDSAWTPGRDYERLEALFLCWAQAGGVRASSLDAVVWSERARRGEVYARLARRSSVARDIRSSPRRTA